MKPVIYGPKLWLGIASARSYKRTASIADQSVALYCDTADISYNGTTKTVAIRPRLEERHTDAYYTVTSGGSDSQSAYSQWVAYTSPVFLVKEGTSTISFTVSGTGKTLYRVVPASLVYYYKGRLRVELFKNDGTLLKSVATGPLTHVQTYPVHFSSGQLTMEYQCNLGADETAYYYFIITTEFYTPSTVDFTEATSYGSTFFYTEGNVSWSSITGYLPTRVASAGQTHYTLLDNYIRPD